MSPPDPAGMTTTVMTQACATFEAVLEVLHGESPQAGPLTGPYVMAAVAAAEGRDAIMTAPAAFLLPADPLPPLSLPGPGADTSAIADALAAVANSLACHLAQAAPVASDPRDREALHAASLAAAAVRDCLLGTG